MKYIKIFFSIVFVASLISSGCNKKLDVDPQQQVTPDQIKDESDVLAVLFGTYSLLQTADAFGELYFVIPDLLAAEKHTVWTGSFFPYDDLFKKQQISTNSLAYALWANAYTTINTLNTVLAKTDVVNEDDRAAIAAEAKFLLGLVYFELVKLYGKPYSAGSTNTNLAVPLMLEPVYDYQPARDNKPRATVEAVYTQVIADLTQAAANLPEETVKGRATKYSALAILSRVYLNQAKYTEAATAANEVIEYYGGTLNGLTFPGAFNKEGAPDGEDLFVILQTSQSNAGTANGGLTTFYLAKTSDDPTIAGGGRGDMQASEDYLDIFEANDVRRAFIYGGKSAGGTQGFYPKKWAEFYRNIPVVRLAEMFLTRGEANFRSGTAQIGDATPLEDINMVRTRSNASALVTLQSTGDDFVEERFRELGFEGDRLWTLKRLKKNVDGLPYDHNKLVLPIPRREREINTKLEQNPGYQ
jgi:starch-binding outer membrane protein, SusD/RagB family